MNAVKHSGCLGVPLAKPRVALSAASPRADYRAVGFPLQSLTRTSPIDGSRTSQDFYLLRIRRRLLCPLIRHTNEKIDQVCKHDTAENGTLHVFVQLKKLVTKPNSCYPKSKGKSQSQIIQSVLQPLFAKTQLHAFLMHIMTECQFFSSRFTNKIGKFWINLGIPAQLFWTRNQPVIKLLRKLKSLSCPTFQPPVLLRHVRNLR
jgi:hypothetical protein